jgi:nitroimidazol reductase NimA-like FMN-containing flavoprotein (pyridoxamine 5'-phosphate oxidase superfamily)/stress response protein SCP2
MRKFEHEVKEKEIIAAILDTAPFIVISATDEDGLPYSVPVCYGAVCDEEGVRIYIHSAREGRKVDLWRKEPVVTCVAAYLYNYVDPAFYYRGVFHDYRCVMLRGKLTRVIPGASKGMHGEAVQAMLRHYGRGPKHFSVPHYRWMDVFVVTCPWDEVSCKAEGPMADLKYVKFPEKGDPPVTDPNEYEWFLCRKYFEKPPVAKAAGAAPDYPSIAGPAKIGASRVVVETTWSDRGEHMDVDAYPLLLKEGEKLERRYDVVFDRQPETFRTAGARFLEDDIENTLGLEKYSLDLDALGEDYESVALVAGVYDADRLGKDLSCADALRVTLKDADSGEVLAIYAAGVVPEGKKAMQIARLVKASDGWYLLPEERAFDKWLIPDVFAEYGLADWRE